MKTNRIIALDAFRGFTVALMILVNNPGNWGHIYAPLRHASWEGCTPTDLVFPFFLFVVGVASFFSFKKYNFTLNKTTFWKLLKRSIIIFLIGLLLNLFPFFNTREPFSIDNVVNTIEKVRIFGVLQRIACAYFIGILLCLLFKTTKKIAITGVSLMILFWAILIAYNPQNPYDKKENACRAVDLIIPGETNCYKGYSRTVELQNLNFTVLDNEHFTVQPVEGANIDLKYLSLSSANYNLKKEKENAAVYNVIPRENITNDNAAATTISQLTAANEQIPFDPEGLLGAMSAAATVIFGFLIGRLVNFYSENKEKLVMHLLLFGLMAVFAGMFWGQWFMINKPLWTGSYVLYAGGLAMIILAFFIWLMDVKQYSQKYFRPFIAFGSNPLFLFVMAGIIAKTLNFAFLYIGDISLQNWIYKNIYQGIIDPKFGSFLYAVSFIFIMWLIAEILYRKKIYIKV